MPANFAHHKALDAYYAALATYRAQSITHEQATRLAFSTLLDALSKSVGWTLVLEQSLANRKRPDGTLYDDVKFPRGYWEAKDTQDNLDAEIQNKIRRGYPLTNIIFEDTQRAVLYQNGRPALDVRLAERSQLANLLNLFFGYTGEKIDEFHQAVQQFRERIPELARSVEATIETERARNQRFAGAFDAFHTICRQAIDPNISADAIEKMLVQHLLTERLFRTVFDDPDFTRRNAIANEIEKVIRALTWNRSAFLQRLDPFYLAIEDAARTISDFSEKQTFLNTVYERFFQGFSKEQADTHGVVYTPQPIVDFMVSSVDEVLQREFGLSLSSEGVKILDPATGTGNFIVNILRRLNRRDLKRKYRDELFANEIMLLPYYIASLNIEHAYYDLAGEYEPFEGICFADTLDLAEAQQLSLFAEENTERVQRQKNAEITVIIGNPPYNVGQVSENDNNKNRRYKVIDEQLSRTYVKDSTATLRRQIYDPYVKFFRWAIDRLQGRNGIVCFVSNNSFVDQNAFDGMRKHLLKDFDRIYHLDLHGNVRKNPKLSGTTHNVFGIQVGVGITIAICNRNNDERFLHYYRVPENWTRIEKLAFIAEKGKLDDIEWKKLHPDNRHSWLTEGMHNDFAAFLPIGSREAKVQRVGEPEVIFKIYSTGIKSGRDDLVFDFDSGNLTSRIREFAENFNAEVSRWIRSNRPTDIDNFVNYNKLKWSRNLKRDLENERLIHFKTEAMRQSLYRPYTAKWLYYAETIVDERGVTNKIFPTTMSETENAIICVTDSGSEKPFMVLLTNTIADLHLVGAGAGTQCFPYYVYDEDGGNRRENITDWALAQFQAAYGGGDEGNSTLNTQHSKLITKRDIFNYVYGLLHSPQYRERYAENLKRELPRIPLVGIHTASVSLDATSDQAAPTNEQAAPTSDRAAPTSDQAAPTSDRAAPSSDRAAPSSDRAAPTSDRAAPTNDRAAPTSEQAAPTSDQAAPASAGAAPGSAAELFWRFADTGAQLAELHLGYERAKEYPLRWVENRAVPFSWRVAKMQLSKDKSELKINESLTLAGIPAECFAYRLGNRSALEWVIDQYQAGTDKRSGITSDPNRSDDEEYIVRLVGRVITVSMETVRLVRELPPVLAEGGA